MKLAPNHRYVQVRDAFVKKTTLTGDKENALLQLLENKLAVGAVAEAVRRAYDIHTHLYKREILESCLLVGVTPKEIYTIFTIPADVTEAYAYLFFDPTVFEDELDKIEYGHTYSKTDFGKDWKQYAVDNGKESVKVRASRGSYVVSPLLVQNEIRATAYMLAQGAKNNSINSETSKEAFRWAQLALRASIEAEEDHVSNIEELSMALDTVDETVNEEKSGLKPEDILH